MARKMLDCRLVPSESGCTLTLIGEEDEVLRAGAAHAVDVHDHIDNEELRDMLRAGLREPLGSNTEPGSFVQLVELRTHRIDDVNTLVDQWAEAIGDARTARWTIETADRDHPHTYLAIVEFPSYQAAMANSDHPVTADFATKLAKLCDQEPVFRNLDVTRVDV
jgi:hypothetical protein